MCGWQDPVAVALLKRIENIKLYGAERVTSEQISELLNSFTMYLVSKSDCYAKESRHDCGRPLCGSELCEYYRKELDDLCALSLQIVFTKVISETEVFNRLSSRILTSISLAPFKEVAS